VYYFNFSNFTHFVYQLAVSWETITNASYYSETHLCWPSMVPLKPGQFKQLAKLQKIVLQLPVFVCSDYNLNCWLCYVCHSIKLLEAFCLLLTS
jgi:hypothetical protein